MSFASVTEIFESDNKHAEMSLEPRLQEYMAKKKYYIDNDIEPSVPLEKQFQITPMDIKIIKSYARGNTNVYDKVAKKYQKEGPSRKKYTFPSKELMNDKRIQQLQGISRDAPVNRGMFVPDRRGRYYEDMETTNNNDQMLFARGFNKGETRFQPRIDPKIDPGLETHSKYESQFRIPPNPYIRETDPDPRNKHIISDLHNRQNRQEQQNKLQQDKLEEEQALKQLNQYYYNEIPKYSAASDMDTRHKVVIPNMGSTSKSDLDYSNYRLENYFDNNDNTMNSELESDLVRGMPTTRTHNRSYGYRNPQENYYDFVDPDFNNPAHTVESWARGGAATRLDNKTIAKNRTYNRDIL